MRARVSLRPPPADAIPQQVQPVTDFVGVAGLLFTFVVKAQHGLEPA